MNRIPYVIDNISVTLADVLRALLAEQSGRQLDIATAYFSVSGWALLADLLPSVRHFRLVLGDQRGGGDDIGLAPDSAAYLRYELNAEPLSAGIGDLYKYFLAARRDSIEQGSIRIFNLLEEVVIRRTRQFIRRAYPEAMIGGKRIKWPERRLRTVRYNLKETYEGLYRQIVRNIEALHLAHYNLETYKLDAAKADNFEKGRQEALVGIFKSRFLKRLESSIDAFRISVERALEFAKTFDEYVQEDVLLDAASFQAAMRLVASVQALRRGLKVFSSSKDIQRLVETVRGLADQQRGPKGPTSETAGPRLRREDLHLICYEYICD